MTSITDPHPSVLTSPGGYPAGQIGLECRPVGPSPLIRLLRITPELHPPVEVVLVGPPCSALPAPAVVPAGTHRDIATAPPLHSAPLVLLRLDCSPRRNPSTLCNPLPSGRSHRK